jgi:hypothetical protein
MAKGGFMLELLASKHAVSDVDFIWRYLYYMYIAFPLLAVYLVIYSLIIGVIFAGLYKMLGLTLPTTVTFDIKSEQYLQYVGLHLLISVALFHFGLLPYLLYPVKVLLSV